MAIKVNMTDVEAGDFEAVDSGRYPCHVYEVNNKVAVSSGNDMIEFVFKVDEAHETAAGRQFWHNCVLMPKALWNLKRTLIGLGVPAEDLTEEIDIDNADLVGRKCVVEVTQEMYDGALRNRVKRVLPADASLGGESTVDVDDL